MLCRFSVNLAMLTSSRPPLDAQSHNCWVGTSLNWAQILCRRTQLWAFYCLYYTKLHRIRRSDSAMCKSVVSSEYRYIRHVTVPIESLMTFEIRKLRKASHYKARRTCRSWLWHIRSLIKCVCAEHIGRVLPLFSDYNVYNCIWPTSMIQNRKSENSAGINCFLAHNASNLFCDALLLHIGISKWTPRIQNASLLLLFSFLSTSDFQIVNSASAIIDMGDTRCHDYWQLYFDCFCRILRKISRWTGEWCMTARKLLCNNSKVLNL